MSNGSERRQFVDLTVEIVSAYLSNNHVRVGDLPEVIGLVHRTLNQLATERGGDPEPAPQVKVTAQAIRRSITPDHLVSFEDGRQYKTLGRHLRGRGLTPEAYRTKWGLPADYPMMARAYSERRSQMAKASGFGGPRRPEQATSSPTTSTAPGKPAEQMDVGPTSEARREVALGYANETKQANGITREPFEDDGLQEGV